MSVNEPSVGLKPQIDKESVTKTLNKMKQGKTSATSGVVLQMLLASGDLGIEWMTLTKSLHRVQSTGRLEQIQLWPALRKKVR